MWAVDDSNASAKKNFKKGNVISFTKNIWYWWLGRSIGFAAGTQHQSKTYATCHVNHCAYVNEQNQGRRFQPELKPELLTGTVILLLAAWHWAVKILRHYDSSVNHRAFSKKGMHAWSTPVAVWPELCRNAYPYPFISHWVSLWLFLLLSTYHHIWWPFNRRCMQDGSYPVYSSVAGDKCRFGYTNVKWPFGCSKKCFPRTHVPFVWNSGNWECISKFLFGGANNKGHSQQWQQQLAPLVVVSSWAFSLKG